MKNTKNKMKNTKNKMKNTKILITVFLMFLISLNVNAVDVNLSECLVLNSTTNYFLQGDFDVNLSGNCLTGENLENISLNCNGFSIIGDNQSYIFYITGTQNNIIIKNCSFINYNIGISLDYASNILIENNSFFLRYSNDFVAIELFDYGNNVSLINNYVDSVYTDENSNGILFKLSCDVLNYSSLYVINNSIFGNIKSTSSKGTIDLNCNDNITLFNNNITNRYNTLITLTINDNRGDGIPVNDLFIKTSESNADYSECENLTNNLSLCLNNLSLYQNYTTFFNDSFNNCSIILNNTNLSLIECENNLSLCLNNNSNCSECELNLSLCNENYNLCLNTSNILNLSLIECEYNFSVQYNLSLTCNESLNLCNLNLTEYSDNLSICNSNLSECLNNSCSILTDNSSSIMILFFIILILIGLFYLTKIL